ncbi:MAG: hypothetical protein CR966_00340 [Pseudomonadales bacterium]|nr:MAG: hypothetical protein CR966_00340 [Pseudomonadales bacterium]
MEKLSPLNQLSHLKQLVSQGQPVYGVFDRVDQINYLDYHSYKLSDKAVSQWRKKLRANQFCFVQIVQPSYRVCVAVATLNWVTSSFCYLYDEENDTLEVIEGLQPFTHNCQFNQSTYQDSIAFRSKKLTVNMEFLADGLQLTIESKLLKLNAHLQRPYAPLSVCTPTGKKGWTYTQKEPMTEVTGELTLKNSEKIELTIDLAGATATLDWSVGYMRRITNWYWTCISGYLADGRHLGLNLATGVNESGASENACWLDGERYHLPAVMFRRVKDTGTGKDTEKEMWKVTNQPLNWSKVKIDLTFTPVNCYKKNDRLVVVDSVFEQWIGYYSGVIDLGDTDLGDSGVVHINKLMGLAEDHYAKW